MALTLYAALSLQSYVLVVLFSITQAAAVAWYLLSYIPGGAPILKVLTKTGLRAIGAVCCRSKSWVGGGGWPWASGNSLLPM
jgi:hypothetical protein